MQTSLSTASSTNSYTKTFDGIDVAGRRLANEVRALKFVLEKKVLEVVNKMPSLRKISFLAHSLGGLFARYAIAILHSVSVETKNAGQSSALIVPTTRGPAKSRCASGLGSIAGLQPINFITLATPHLGVRGRNQVHHQNVSVYICKIYCTLSSKGLRLDSWENELSICYFVHSCRF